MQKVQVSLEHNSQDEIKMPPEEINQVQESLQDEITVFSEEIVQVQENLQDEIKVLSEEIVHVEEKHEMKLSSEEINQVQEILQSSITWIKPKRIRWKNFTQPEKLQSTIVISIKSKFSPILSIALEVS